MMNVYYVLCRLINRRPASVRNSIIEQTVIQLNDFEVDLYSNYSIIKQSKLDVGLIGCEQLKKLRDSLERCKDLIDKISGEIGES